MVTLLLLGLLIGFGFAVIATAIAGFCEGSRSREDYEQGLRDQGIDPDRFFGRK